jgi:hypothetical protein
MEYEDMSKHQPDRMAHTHEPRTYNEPEVPLQQVHRDTIIDPSEFINRSNLLERSDELTPSLVAMTPAAAVASPRTEIVSPPVETIIEVPNKRARKDALAAFLAADFLSRKRDRKLRRELRNTQKTNEKVTEQIQRKQNLADRKIEHIMRKSNVPESSQLPPPPPVITERIIIKPKEVFRAESLSSYQQHQVSERPKIIEKPPQDLSPKPHPESKNIDRQMEFVENRSNQYDPEQEDQTPEVFFDRRHEVMDEATKRPRVVATPAFSYSGGATSIGSVLQNQPRPQISTQMSQPQPSGKQPVIPQDSKLYKQSIQYGIASAMFIVVLAIIAYMMS